MTKKRYEVEVKVEVTEIQRQQIIENLLNRGFVDKGSSPQEDYYVKAVESLNNAFDFVRYRSEGSQFFYTCKEWEIEGSAEPVRREEERDLSEEEFAAAVESFPNALTILKERRKFAGTYENQEIEFSIDSVNFSHSEFVRHFIEPEVIVFDKVLIPETRTFLRKFIVEILGLKNDNIVEAPGMFAMAYKKL